MQQNLFYFLYSSLFYPKNYLQTGKDNEENPHQPLGSILKVSLWGMALIFALFILGFTYKPAIWHFRSSDPLYPYLGLFNALSLFIIGLVFYWMWVGVDTIFLKLVAPNSNKEMRYNCLISSQTPWLVLIPYYVIMRLLYAGSYFAWNYAWLAILHIVLALGWHYLNFSLSLFEMVSKSQNTRKNLFLLGFYLCFIIGLIVVLMIYTPMLFRSTASEFLRQIF
jgi:hypothetical protein